MAWHFRISDDSSRVAWLRPRGRAGFRLAIADHRSPGNRPPAPPWRSFPAFLALALVAAFPITDAVSVAQGQTVPGRQALEKAPAVKEWRIVQPPQNQRVDTRHAETRQEPGDRPTTDGDTPVDQTSYRSYPTHWDGNAPVELLPLDIGTTRFGRDSFGGDGLGCDGLGCDGHAGCGCERCDGPDYGHGMGRGGAVMSAAGPGARVWFSAEYLHWTISGSELPPLVRSSPDGSGIAQTGVLTAPGQTLVGGDSSDATWSGYRIGGGFWLDDCQTRAIEVTYSGLPGKTDRDRFDEFSHPLLGRPVFDTELPGESAMLVAYPGIMAGDITVSRSSELHHIEALRRDLRFQNRCRRIDSLVGLRFASLEESILIQQSSRFLVPQGQIIAGTQKDLFDRFETRNRFQGFVLGFDYTERIGIVHLNARGTLGLGGNRAEVTIDGQTVTTVPGLGDATFDGGLLAQPTNIGTYRRTRFSVMPEIYTGLKMPLRNCWELSAGYHWLYWSEAAQVAGQIDRNVSQFPPETPTGALAPVGLLDTGGILIHGLQVGLSCEF